MKRREIEICRRLREARKKLGLSQLAVAERLHISRDRWASYEAMRAPIKWFYGFLFCAEFEIGLQWLATGTGIFKEGLVGIRVGDTADIPFNLSLARAYDQFLIPLLAARVKSSKTAATHSENYFTTTNIAVLRRAVEFWVRVIPEEDLGAFVKFVFRRAEDYRNNKSVAWRWVLEAGRQQEFDPAFLFAIHHADLDGLTGPKLPAA